MLSAVAHKRTALLVRNSNVCGLLFTGFHSITDMVRGVCHLNRSAFLFRPLLMRYVERQEENNRIQSVVGEVEGKTFASEFPSSLMAALHHSTMGAQTFIHLKLYGAHRGRS